MIDPPLRTFKTSDGLKLAYYIDDFSDPWRKAPVVLMLHSAMGSARRFFSIVPPLARDCRVVRLDLRGHGASEVPPENSPLDRERLGRDVLELLDALELDAAHVLGNSAGGFIAQHLAIHHPQRVKSLVLYGATPGFKGEQGKRWLREAAERGFRTAFGESIAERFPVERVDPGLIDWFMDEISKNDVAYIGRFVGYWSDTDFTEEVHRIACPTLIVVPGAAKIGQAHLFDEMKRRIAKSELVVYEDAPHNICDFLPDRCAADALGFLRRHFPREF